MKKLTCKRLKNLIKDEKMATKEYKQYGFKKLSMQENSHRKFLEKKMKGICR